MTRHFKVLYFIVKRSDYIIVQSRTDISRRNV